jgi:diguanylate cyclase (GGDEF)-like protein
MPYLDIIKEGIARLRENYISHLPDRIAAIDALWSEIRLGRADTSAFHTLHRFVHSLAGSGATFDLHQMSATAQILEERFLSLLHGKSAPDNALYSEIDQLLEQLRHAAHAGIHGDTADYALSLPANLPRFDTPYINRLVFLLTDDLELTRDLEFQIDQFGYSIRAFSHNAELQRAIEHTSPIAMIVDGACLIRQQAELDDELEQMLRSTSIPVLFVSSHNDVATHLSAVRAGSDAYFTTPINIAALVDALDRLTTQRALDPYRILIVDDEELLAQMYAHSLQQAGLVAQVVSDPDRVMHVISEFQPDLILMDVYMPGCNGVDLARVIHQQEAYVSLPIVFLSTETRLERQLAAMRLGGDAFLIKPIAHDHLISIVSSRVERSRLLRSLMLRDSLTGLFNHTTAKRHIDIELARAEREGTPMSLAFIDIDYFKAVNDTYGHLSGDHVIKSLARLLQQRLRKTDVVGRYGGEEFVVVLTNTDGATARRVIDSIRAGFERIRHQSDTAGFTVTFSCGIASFPEYKNIESLSSAADKALYEAKNWGRNRVVLSSYGMSEPYAAPYRTVKPPPIPHPLQQITQPGDNPTRRNELTKDISASVLVIDNDTGIGRILSSRLTARGCRVTLATSGVDGIDQLERETPDLVFLDSLLTDISCWQVLDHLQEVTDNLAVVLMIPAGAEQAALDALRRGADDYLCKPIDTKAFQAVFERTMTRLKLKRANVELRNKMTK